MGSDCTCNYITLFTILTSIIKSDDEIGDLSLIYDDIEPTAHARPCRDEISGINSDIGHTIRYDTKTSSSFSRFHNWNDN